MAPVITTTVRPGETLLDARKRLDADQELVTVWNGGEGLTTMGSRRPMEW